jgi:hypothetical protein
VGGVGAVADRPEAVERGGVLARGVAVGGAADRRLVELQSQLAAEVPGQAPQGLVAGERLHRRLLDATFDPDRGLGVDRPEGADGGLDLGGVLPGPDPHVHAGPHLGGDDVRPQPAVDCPHVHGDAAGRVVECEEPLDLVGHLQDRARPFLGVDAGVCGPALDGDREAAGGLASRLQLPRPPERRFQDEGPHRAAGQPANERGGVGAADLLVGVDHDHTFGRWPQAEVGHRTQRVEHLHQSALHVEDARPPDGFPLDADRHLSHRADRPDGVAVADEQL